MSIRCVRADVQALCVCFCVPGLGPACERKTTSAESNLLHKRKVSFPPQLFNCKMQFYTILLLKCNSCSKSKQPCMILFTFYIQHLFASVIAYFKLLWINRHTTVGQTRANVYVCWDLSFSFSLLHKQPPWSFYEYELCHKIWALQAGERKLKSFFCDCCSSAADSAGAAQYIGRPSDGSLNPGGTKPSVCCAASQGGPSHPSPPPTNQCSYFFFLLLIRE